MEHVQRIKHYAKQFQTLYHWILKCCEILCCHPSRPGRFMVFVHMEKYSQGRCNVCHAFIHRWASHGMLQDVCLSACLTSWHLLPTVASIVAPVPLCVSHRHCPQQGGPTCLSTRGEQSRRDATNYIT